ncbi:Krueppellike factor 5like [Caligus rogercresseyi]|uniref:Krueppellike factor 5like n=1 Tax=Caligus rogercresseyi TaxID=217165 RepID=A0A7T8HGK9_CALRO|nr:Krueppellike factor 5like [Caligus rogercresseyi]
MVIINHPRYELPLTRGHLPSLPSTAPAVESPSCQPRPSFLTNPSQQHLTSPRGPEDPLDLSTRQRSVDYDAPPAKRCRRLAEHPVILSHFMAEEGRTMRTSRRRRRCPAQKHLTASSWRRQNLIPSHHCATAKRRLQSLKKRRSTAATLEVVTRSTPRAPISRLINGLTPEKNPMNAPGRAAHGSLPAPMNSLDTTENTRGRNPLNVDSAHAHSREVIIYLYT